MRVGITYVNFTRSYILLWVEVRRQKKWIQVIGDDVLEATFSQIICQH